MSIEQCVSVAFGSDYFFLIAEAPNNINAISGSLVANASGTVRVSITPLITPEEVDRAAQKQYIGARPANDPAKFYLKICKNSYLYNLYLAKLYYAIFQGGLIWAVF
jgi:hypothetical protein